MDINARPKFGPWHDVHSDCPERINICKVNLSNLLDTGDEMVFNLVELREYYPL